MNPGQKRKRDTERRAAKSAKGRADYEARQMEKARQAGIKARTLEEAKAWAAKRESEQAQLRQERAILQREADRIDAERWHRERAEQQAARTLAAAELADATKAQAEHGTDRAYCRLDVSSGVRCWLLPGHQSPCRAQPAPTPPPRRMGGHSALLAMLMMVATSDPCPTPRSDHE